MESTESEFLAIERPKRVKNHKEKLYAPLVQKSEEKYCLQVKIFELYPSGTKCQGGTLQNAGCHLGTSFDPKTGKKAWRETIRTTGAVPRDNNR